MNPVDQLRDVLSATGRWIDADARLCDQCERQYPGLSEADIVAALATAFDSLGYRTTREEKVYSTNDRLDLLCDIRPPAPRWMIEAKILWDGWDHRLNRRRFEEKREILWDIDRLADLRPERAHKAIVWAGFSQSSKLDEAGATARTLRLGDAVNSVNTHEKVFDLPIHSVISVGDVTANPQWSFVHLLGWLIP